MGKTKLVRWPRLVFGAFVLLFAGIIYAWSILKAPFESMWDAGQLGLNYTLTVCFFCLGGLTSGIISKKTTPMLRLIISAVLLFSGFFIASRLIGSEGASDVLLYLSYGVLCGTGIGFAYNTVISMTNAWYPDKTGFSSGILLAGFGLSSLIIGRVADEFGEMASVGWVNTYVIIAISLGVILLAAAFIVKPPPAGTVTPEKKKGKKSQPQEEIRDFSTSEMIKRLSFTKLFVIMVVLSATGSAAIGFAKDIVLDVGADAGFAVTVVGLLAVANGLGRFAIGWLYDNIGTRKTQYIVSVAAVAAPLAVMFAVMANSLALGVAGLCLCGFAFGLAPTTGSVFAAKFYGAKNFPLNFSVVNLALIPAAFAATLAGELKKSTGDFLTVFAIITAISLVGAVINLTMKKA